MIIRQSECNTGLLLSVRVIEGLQLHNHDIYFDLMITKQWFELTNSEVMPIAKSDLPLHWHWLQEISICCFKSHEMS